MKRLSLFSILFVLSCSICSANFSSSQALSKAEQFVSLVDGGEYRTAYLSSSELLRLSTPEDEWIVERRLSERLLGHVLERKLVSLKARDTYPGLPDGDYLVVYFEAQTEFKVKAAEVLLLCKSADRWEVCSYRLK